MMDEHAERSRRAARRGAARILRDRPAVAWELSLPGAATAHERDRRRQRRRKRRRRDKHDDYDDDLH